MNVLDQGGHRLVARGWQLHPFEDVMIDGVVVPVSNTAAHRPVQRDGDQLDPGLDQPARQQALLAPEVASIAVTDSRVLPAHVEGPACFRACQQVPCLLLEGIEGLDVARPVDVPRKPSRLFRRPMRRPSRSASPAGIVPRFGTWKEGEFGSPWTANGSYDGPRYAEPR